MRSPPEMPLPEQFTYTDNKDGREFKVGQEMKDRGLTAKYPGKANFVARAFAWSDPI